MARQMSPPTSELASSLNPLQLSHRYVSRSYHVRLQNIFLLVVVLLSCTMLIEARRSKQHSTLEAIQQMKHKDGQADQYVSLAAAIVDQPLGRSIIATAPDLYTVPINTPLYHATATRFSEFRERPTWFSMDRKEGWTMLIAQHIGEDVYVRTTRAKRALNLFLMKRTEAASKAALMAITRPDGSVPWAAASFQVATVPGVGVGAHPVLTGPRYPLTHAGLYWYAAPSVGAPITEQFIRAFCAIMQPLGYDGWRNPWDQDEIMLCSIVYPVSVAAEVVIPGNVGTPITDKITMGGGYYCPNTKWVNLLSNQGSAAATTYKIVFKNEQRGAALQQRMHFLTIPRAWIAGAPAPFAAIPLETLAAQDVSPAAFAASCCLFDTQWATWESIEATQARVTQNNIQLGNPHLTAQQRTDLTEANRQLNLGIARLQATPAGQPWNTQLCPDVV